MKVEIVSSKDLLELKRWDAGHIIAAKECERRTGKTLQEASRYIEATTAAHNGRPDKLGDLIAKAKDFFGGAGKAAGD